MALKFPPDVAAKDPQALSRFGREATGELCQRAGTNAYLAGTIASLGSEYVLGLKAMNWRSGDTLAEEQVTAASKEEVLDTPGQASTKLRGERCKSLATVQKLDVPLGQATTSSLEAQKAYCLGSQGSFVWRFRLAGTNLARFSPM